MATEALLRAIIEIEYALGAGFASHFISAARYRRGCGVDFARCRTSAAIVTAYEARSPRMTHSPPATFTRFSTAYSMADSLMPPSFDKMASMIFGRRPRLALVYHECAPCYTNTRGFSLLLAFDCRTDFSPDTPGFTGAHAERGLLRRCVIAILPMMSATTITFSSILNISIMPAYHATISLPLLQHRLDNAATIIIEMHDFGCRDSRAVQKPRRSHTHHYRCGFAGADALMIAARIIFIFSRSWRCATFFRYSRLIDSY